MTGTAIPELVARLRELRAKLQALQVGTPEFTAARQLFRDVLQLSAPAILDALDHIGDANKMAPHSPWLPIETAPRDGTEVALLFAREETVTFGVLSTWPRVRAAFFTVSDWSIPYYANNPPIGWSPLPAPPAAEGGEGGWSGDSEGWVLRQRDLDEFDSPRDITHVHQMGPIRGPGETT